MNDSSYKVLTVNDQLIDKIDNKLKKLVVCFGHFNVIHPGHLRYLKYARSLGDSLIVALHADAGLVKTEAENYFSENERAEGVSLLSLVDYVVILDNGRLDDFVKQLKPRILVLGSEHEFTQDEKINSAISILTKQKGKVVFHAGEAVYANVDLLHTRRDVLEREKIEQFKNACHNQKINSEILIQRLNQIKDTNLLVVGDTIVDQYVACDAMGMSAEAPVLVVRELESREFIGGAAVVASHIRALGAKCHYISVLGEDSNANNIRDELVKRDVQVHLISDASRPTTYKIRYMVDNQKLFRVSKLKEHKLTKKIEDKVIAKIKELGSSVDGILVSDFVYGVITDNILSTIQDVAKKYELKTFGDIQCSSQMGKVTKFKNFDLVFPTEREARYALENNVDGVEWIANTLMEKLDASKVLVTLGSEGFIAYLKQMDGFVVRQHYPALSVNPVDVAGAGDSLMAAVATCISSGSSIMEASAIGACMASLSVREVGNVPINSKQLKDYIIRTGLQ